MRAVDSIKSTPSAIRLTFLYCLPAIFAIGLVLGSYYVRVGKVATFIETQRDHVESAYQDVVTNLTPSLTKDQQYVEIATMLPEHKLLKETPKTSDHLKRLTDHYVRQRLANINKTSKEYIDKDNDTIWHEIFGIWSSNAIKIAILAIFPFLLLGSHLGFSPKLEASYKVRVSVVNKSWWIKFLIGLIIVYGWVYVLNPLGRGAGTIEQFLTNVDLSQANTIPDLLKGGILQPIIAGFLGWYLYLLTYFFSKVFTHDVLSTNVYGLMFQKFLFTYGVAIILPSIQATAGVEAEAVTGLNTTIVIAFFIGFFPMSAFSILKDSGLKMIQGNQVEKGQLQELPGISRWQILRLEEEGVDSMGALAAYNRPEELRQNIPSMCNLVDYWIDIARLYTILGQEAYLKVRKHCKTSSEFVLRASDSEFAQALTNENIINTLETARILKLTFPDELTHNK